MTDGQLVEAFLRQYPREQTRLAYRHDLHQLLASLGGRSLRQLTAHEVSAFASHVAFCKSSAGSGYSLASQARKVIVSIRVGMWGLKRRK